MTSASPFPPAFSTVSPRVRRVSAHPFASGARSVTRSHPLVGLEHLFAALLEGRLRSHSDFARLLELLRQRESQLVALADALFATLGFEPSHPWRHGAVALANRALLDREARAAYHNHRHVFEVTCCFWQLATSGADALGRTDLALGVLAALAHDLDFDPVPPHPASAAELHSADLAQAFLGPHVDAQAGATIEKLILATEPGCYDAIRSDYLALGAPGDDTAEDRWVRTAALLVRADLTPSTALHERYNFTLSHLLRRETGLEVFDQPEARWRFVHAHAPFTRSETARGFDDAHAWLVADLQRGLPAGNPRPS